MNWNPTDGRGRGRRHQHGAERRQHHPGPGPDDFNGPGFGPRGGRRGPGPRGSHGGPGGPGRRRGRTPRGDVRAAVLVLLADEPMHGYQLMQAIGERSGGRWTPSPGAIYPVLQQLEDEGLVTIAAESGRKVASLTDAGRDHLAEQTRDPFDLPGADGPDLRELVHSVAEATRAVGRTGTTEQRTRAAELLTETRRALYLLLAEAPTD